MGVKTLRREDIARQVHEVLDLPKGEGWNIRNCEANRIVRAVFDAIVKGLLEDGEVQVRGFGRFYINRRKGLTPAYYNYHQGGRHWELIPRKPRVIFRPGNILKRFVNES